MLPVTFVSGTRLSYVSSSKCSKVSAFPVFPSGPKVQGHHMHQLSFHASSAVLSLLDIWKLCFACAGSWHACARAEGNIKSPRAGGRNSCKMLLAGRARNTGRRRTYRGVYKRHAADHTLHGIKGSGGATDGGETHEHG